MRPEIKTKTRFANPQNKHIPILHIIAIIDQLLSSEILIQQLTMIAMFLMLPYASSSPLFPLQKILNRSCFQYKNIYEALHAIPALDSEKFGNLCV